MTNVTKEWLEHGKEIARLRSVLQEIADHPADCQASPRSCRWMMQNMAKRALAYGQEVRDEK